MPGPFIPKEILRFLAITVVGGLLFYLSLAFLMGFAAARPYPELFRPFAEEHPMVALALWELLVKVPVIIALSVVWSLLLSRLCSTRLLAAGVATLLVALVFALFVVSLVSQAGNSLGLQTAARYLLPDYIVQTPTFLALYLTLPCACWYLQRTRES